MSEKNVPILGVPPTENDRRDAIHIAIAPVIAGEILYPGMEVGMLEDGKFGVTQNPIGIVDPFLKVVLIAGNRFWLCLFPGSVTSLRHVWVSPHFKPKTPE